MGVVVGALTCSAIEHRIRGLGWLDLGHMKGVDVTATTDPALRAGAGLEGDRTFTWIRSAKRTWLMFGFPSFPEPMED